MRVGVNLMFLVPGVVGGSEPLLTNLVLHASRMDVSIVVFGVRGLARAYPDIAETCRIIEAPWSTGAQGLRIAAENSWLQLTARSLRLDVLHHGVGTTPYLRSTPATATIHDIQYMHYPENFAAPKLVWLRANVPHSIRSCRRVAVPSAWVKGDLVERLGADPERIDVIPFGSEGLLGDNIVDEDTVRDRYGLRRPFFLFPGRTYRHKNHGSLIRSFEPIAESADLVFTGPRWNRDEEVLRFADSMGIAKSVRHLGQIPREDLGGLYRCAVALAYPTRFEGFGAPALEAMSAGCPVIASNVTAVPEVVDTAGILLDPDDVAGWTAAMRTLLDEPEERKRLTAAGTARCERFDWDISAEAQVRSWKAAAS